MGLDMYLTRKISMWDWTPKEEKINVKGKFAHNQHLEKTISLQNINSLNFEIGYWRKANHIHNWFVKHVQNGQDDCQPYYVSKEQLEELLQTCYKTLEIWSSDTKPEKKEEELEELLPTLSGFFFGNTDYDEGYISEIQTTINIIEKEKENNELWEDSCVYYHYQSSW